MSAILHEVSTASPSAWSLSRLLHGIRTWLRHQDDAPAQERGLNRLDLHAIVREAGRERAELLTRWARRPAD